MNTEKVTALLSAIAHDSRLGVVRLLVPSGPDGMAASKIAEELDIAPASLTFHLKKLTRVRLIIARAQGRHIIYSANLAVVNDLIAFLAENCGGQIPHGLETARLAS